MNLEQTKNIDRLVNEKLGDEQNVEQLATLDNINRVQARKPKTNRDKKGKKTFSLFGIYSDVKISLAQAETVVLEYVQIVDGQVVLNPTGEALQKVSKEAAELINEAVVLYQEVHQIAFLPNYLPQLLLILLISNKHLLLVLCLS